MKHIPINQWRENEKPREKLQKLGRSALSDAELLGIILGTGIRANENAQQSISKSAVDLGQEILEITGGNLAELARLSLEELTQIKGIGPAKALTLIAALELGNRRRWITDTETLPVIRTSKDAYELFKFELQDLPVEQFWVAFLNRANKVIKKMRISEGGIDGTIADPTIIGKFAVLSNARAVILCHNHPSNQLKPSPQDIQLTEKIKKGLLFLDIYLHDHLIVTQHNYYSFADEGMM